VGKIDTTLEAMKRKPNTSAESIAITLVSLLSLAHIGLNISEGFQFSFINTLIGIAFIICFFKNLSAYKALFIIWAFLQVFELNFSVGNHVVNFDQVFSAGFGLQMNLRGGGFVYIGLGYAGIFYMALAVKVKMDSLYGSVVRLKSFKKDSFLNDFLPADVKIVKRLKIGDDNSWFLVEFVEKEDPKYGLIKGKEDYMIKKGKNQIVQFMKVDDPSRALYAKTLDKSAIKTGAWAVVE
jgi:hypothetical protein